MQTPQFFYNVVPNADIFNHHNLTFYQAMQPGLDAWGATVCCGTNFVARASAMAEVDCCPPPAAALPRPVYGEGYDR